jgi:hypothetical protein
MSPQKTSDKMKQRHATAKTPAGQFLRLMHHANELDRLWSIVQEVLDTKLRPDAKTKRTKFVFARHIFYAMACRINRWSLQVLADYTGRTDHSTVIHGRDKIEALCELTPLGKPYDPFVAQILGNCLKAYSEGTERFEVEYKNTQPKLRRWLTAGYL